MTAALPPPRLLAAVAVGGAVGAVARWALTDAFPADPDGLPWATLAINVIGSLGLALLPASARVRRNRVLTAALGPGVLGGFTTLSTCSEQSRVLVDSGRAGLAAVYLLVTLAACLAAVVLAGRWSTGPRRRLAAEAGRDR